MTRFKIFSAILLVACIAHQLTGVLSTNYSFLTHSLPLTDKNIILTTCLVPDNLETSGALVNLGTNHGQLKGTVTYLSASQGNLAPSVVAISLDQVEDQEAAVSFRLKALYPALMQCITVCCLIALLVLAMQLIIGFTRQKVFSNKQLVRLYWIAGLLGAINIINLIAGWLNYHICSEYLQIEGWRIVMPAIDLSLTLGACLILVMSELLRQATLLKEENDLTV